MQTISPCLWFDRQAEEAINYYASIFKGSRVVDVMRFGDAGPGPSGTVLAASLEMDGQTLIAMNGGPMFKFTPAISLFIHCRTQAEIDHYWSKLLAGGQAQQCGWLTDKFGVTWQVVPTMLGQMLRDPDAMRAARVMKVMLTMVKLDIAALTQAYG